MIKPFNPAMTETGELYLKRGRNVVGSKVEASDVWQLIGYITHPAAILLNLRTGERHVEIIGSETAKEFIHLVPEVER